MTDLETNVVYTGDAFDVHDPGRFTDDDQHSIAAFLDTD